MSTTDLNNDEARGKLLFIGFCALLLTSVAIYLGLHVSHKESFVSTYTPPGSTGLEAIDRANFLLSNGKDQLTATEGARLLALATSIRALEPELSQRETISNTLTLIDAELEADIANKPELVRLFVTLEEQIRIDSMQLSREGAGGFWSEGVDRWIEVAFWSLFGTLVFLLSEIKYWSCHPRYDYTKYTIWYFANLLRGPFVTLLILFALSSLAITIVGIDLDVNNAPIEALIFLAAVLGFYSRTATKVLDQVVKKIFPSAWWETLPETPTGQTSNQKTKARLIRVHKRYNLSMIHSPKQ